MTKKSDAPAIRFKGFSDAWEQRKLGDIADIVGGGTPSTGNQSYWDGDIDWYAPAEIADQIYANSSQKKINPTWVMRIVQPKCFLPVQSCLHLVQGSGKQLF